MGYSVNGQCYPDTLAALSAFSGQFPQVTPSGVNSLSGTPSITPAGQVSYSLAWKGVSGGADMTTAFAVQLQSCEVSMSQYPTQSLLFVFALFFSLVMGFHTGMKL